MPGAADLSLGAELLLLSVDPGSGGVLPHKRRRMRKALRAAGSNRRRALRELRRAQLIKRDRPYARIELADRAEAGARFRRLREALADRQVEDDRQCDLVFLLAWTGVLAARLSAHERRAAARHVRALAENAASSRPVAVPAANAALSPVILALGLAATDELIHTPLGPESGAGDASVAGTDLSAGGGPD